MAGKKVRVLDVDGKTTLAFFEMVDEPAPKPQRKLTTGPVVRQPAPPPPPVQPRVLRVQAYNGANERYQYLDPPDTLNEVLRLQRERGMR